MANMEQTLEIMRAQMAFQIRESDAGKTAILRRTGLLAIVRDLERHSQGICLGARLLASVLLWCYEGCNYELFKQFEPDLNIPGRVASAWYSVMNHRNNEVDYSNWKIDVENLHQFRELYLGIILLCIVT
jgi:hypothetical protein